MSIIVECFEMCDEVEATICCFCCSKRDKCEGACSGEDCERKEKAANPATVDDLRE